MNYEELYGTNDKAATDTMSPESLIKKALAAREYAYMPYSGFAVGAALLCEDGSVFTGCNVENAAYGASICAERVAAAKAVSFGYKSFTAAAIAGGEASLPIKAPCLPCGICRQFLSEFCGEDVPVYLATSETEYEETTFGELFPRPFSL